MNDILAVGVAPDIMGVGPAYAIPDALKKANLTVQQFILLSYYNNNNDHDNNDNIISIGQRYRYL